MSVHRIKKKYLVYGGLICLGILLRFAVMTLGYNYDFESYCIAGEISGNLRNVYAETARYNYGPIFLCIQGLFYRISQANPENWMQIYRVLIVSLLTLTDLGITAFIAKRYSPVKAMIFFLNPVSIIITGYHNQFDNIAVLFALLSISFFNEETELNRKDIGFIALFSLSLITKHILFLMPIFILLMKNLPVKKKVLYFIVPPVIFLLSFVPFALAGNEAFQGIIDHVFLYRSFNNAPLFILFYMLAGIPREPRFFIYILLMIVTACLVRKLRFEQILMIYLIAMVTFSSAIANQYLAIPMAALCVLNVGLWDKLYMIAVGVYLVMNSPDALGLVSVLQAHFPESILTKLFTLYNMGGYIVAVWILLFALIHLIRCRRRGEPLIV